MNKLYRQKLECVIHLIRIENKKMMKIKGDTKMQRIDDLSTDVTNISWDSAMFWITVIGLFVTIRVAFVANKRSKESNKISSNAKELSEDANNIANEAKKISYEANKIAIHTSDSEIIFSLFQAGIIGKEILCINNERLFYKEIDKKRKTLRKKAEKVMVPKMELERYFDVIVDPQELIIYYAKGNELKKVIYDECYAIIDQIRLVNSYLKDTALIEKFESFLEKNDESKKGTTGKLISNYGYAIDQKEINFSDGRKTEEIPENIKKLWSNPVNMKKYSYSEQKGFDEAIKSIKSFYSDFYIYNNILNVYNQSLFKNKGGSKR